MVEIFLVIAQLATDLRLRDVTVPDSGGAIVGTGAAIFDLLASGAGGLELPGLGGATSFDLTAAGAGQELVAGVSTAEAALSAAGSGQEVLAGASAAVTDLVAAGAGVVESVTTAGMPQECPPKPRPPPRWSRR